MAIRLTEAEKAAIDAAADGKASTWARDVLLRAVKRRKNRSEGRRIELIRLAPVPSGGFIRPLSVPNYGTTFPHVRRNWTARGTERFAP